MNNENIITNTYRKYFYKRYARIEKKQEKNRGNTMKILIYKERTKRNISLRELEKMTGISDSTISRYERVGNENANIRHLEEIAKALRINIEDLYDSPCKRK